MNTPIKSLVLAATAVLVATAGAPAQTYSVIKSFGILTNLTGAHPNARLVQGQDGTLYGTTCRGGYYDATDVAGTVFRMTPDGTGFRVLKWFTNSVSEGGGPAAALTISTNTLYGTTYFGGNTANGTIFKLNTDGSGYTVLKHFDSVDGAHPMSQLTLSGDTLYGTAAGGGSFGDGTIFKIKTDGTSFTVLKSLALKDGSNPQAGLTLSGNTLYGIARDGGKANAGTLFRINTDGSGFGVLRNFFATDGENPCGDVIISGGMLYGTTFSGGNFGYGTVFKINTDGTGLMVLKHFEGMDGERPQAGLTISGSTLYGTTVYGGSVSRGTVFKINTNGTGYALLKDFADFPEGSTPNGGVTLAGTTLYGTAYYGGNSDCGIIFKVSTSGTGYAVLQQFVDQVGDAGPAGELAISGTTLYGHAGSIFKINIDGSCYGSLTNLNYLTEGLVISGETLYGAATRWLEARPYSTIFKIGVDGSGLTFVKNFAGADGENLRAVPLLLGSTLYGTAWQGGASNYGTIFRINSDGTGFAVIKDFAGDDGALLWAGLTPSGDTLYGTACGGGTFYSGTIFRLNTDGSAFTTLKHFGPVFHEPTADTFTNSDGATPTAGVTLSGSALYGTTSQGGNWGNGTVFKINTDGTGFTVLKDLVTVDGVHPSSPLTLVGNTLYGTTETGGNSGLGTIFKINTDGTGFVVVKSFTGWDGANPRTHLVQVGNSLYGTTFRGGEMGLGTVFSFGLAATPIPLNIKTLSGQAVLTWSEPTFHLQSAPLPAGTFTNIPRAASPYTNAAIDSQRFFRLIGN